MKLTRELTRTHLPAYWSERQLLFTNRQADLSELSEIDSIGLAFLVQWSQALAVEQRPLGLLAPPASFYPLADLYGVSSFFELTDTFAGSHNGTE
ncbi:MULTISPECIES: STAS domain-containing protein [Oceanisphaera]|uniref:Lipid asymmetry maintenance protein MlaB n=1 Tax=Oceanisphaera ostreae TaxID=914151 RepID=A0ABW3KF83_9GAMM